MFAIPLMLDLTSDDCDVDDQPSAEPQSILERRTINNVCNEIMTVYRKHHMPWVVGFSAGKDSTLLVQLVIEAIRRVPLPERRRLCRDRQQHIYVIAGDTGVETPQVEARLGRALLQIGALARHEHLPLTTHKVSPRLQDDFWVCVLGRGYAAPHNVRFRWCVDRLKIGPSTAFVRQRISEAGQVLTVLGTRETESAARRARMQRLAIPGTPLQRNTSIPGALVYAPIREFTTDDVWTTLLQRASPWGGAQYNRDLAALYRAASVAGECPLVMETASATCQNSRFGCWTCTVSSNASLIHLLDQPEYEWMLPMLDIYDFLRDTNDADKKNVYRAPRLDADGNILYHHRGKLAGVGITPGRYTMDTRIHLLRMLLGGQRQMRDDLRALHANGTGARAGLPYPHEVELLGIKQLQAIRYMWLHDSDLRFRDRDDIIPAIYAEEMGVSISWPDRYACPFDIGGKRRGPVGVKDQLSFQWDEV